MSRTFVDKKTGWIMYEMPEPCDAKFLIVAAEGGKVIEINHFGTLKESKRIFEEIAGDYRYRPSKVNSSGRLDVSIWKLTENRYEKIDYYS